MREFIELFAIAVLYIAAGEAHFRCMLATTEPCEVTAAATDLAALPHGARWAFYVAMTLCVVTWPVWPLLAKFQRN